MVFIFSDFYLALCIVFSDFYKYLEVDLFSRQPSIQVYVNQPLKADWALIIVSIFLCQRCGHLFLRMFQTMIGAWVRLCYLIVIYWMDIHNVNVFFPWVDICNVQPALQIVSTLVGNKNYADKMLMYAENHNQV